MILYHGSNMTVEKPDSIGVRPHEIPIKKINRD